METYNHYQGNSGRVRRVDETGTVKAPARPGAGAPIPVPGPSTRPVMPPGPGQRRPPGPLSGLSGELGKLLRKLSSAELETEDLIIIMILYLLYKESGDGDYLVMIAGMLLL